MHDARGAAAILLMVLLLTPLVEALPSGGTMPPKFRYSVGEWYDGWGIMRTNPEGRYGYLPQLLSEAVRANKELAYGIGERFRESYTDQNAMAVAILKYVQKWTEYGYDSDNVVMEGVPQLEWAWNADESAHSFNEATGIVAVGDCEDMAFLCATIYIGAGIDIAIVSAPSHAALLIWLPDYPNANAYWDLTDDDRGAGWIWVEATGPANPLGWTPSDFSDGYWTAYTLDDNVYNSHQPIQMETDGETDGISWELIVSIIVAIFMILLRRGT